MPNTITAYELRSWIDTIPTPCLETQFPTTHPIYADANCQLVVHQECEKPMLQAMLEECPGLVAAWCVVSFADAEGGGR